MQAVLCLSQSLSVLLPLLDFTQKKISKFFQPDSNTITNGIITKYKLKRWLTEPANLSAATAQSTEEYISIWKTLGLPDH